MLQVMMCESFTEWGLPKAIKVDNGKPFGDPQRCSVPEVALWLIGLGIEVIWNRPRSPRDNAKVERMQGTTSRWVDVQRCGSCVQLQSRLDKVAVLHRESYQVKRLGYKCRKERYTPLWHNCRKYEGKRSFDISRVKAYLNGKMFERKVNTNGTFCFYAQSVYLGYKQRNQTVGLFYEADKEHFVIKEQQGKVIGYLSADNFSQDNVMNLTVCQNRYVKCYNFMSL